MAKLKTFKCGECREELHVSQRGHNQSICLDCEEHLANKQAHRIYLENEALESNSLFCDDELEDA